MTGRASSRRAVVAVAVGYLLLSIISWFVGWRWADRLFDTLSALGAAAAQLVLGPLGFAFNVGAGIAGAEMAAVWVLFYVMVSAVLFVCLLLTRRSAPMLRTIGVAAAIVVWLASGLLNVIALLQGI